MEDKIASASKALSNDQPERARRLLEQALRGDPSNVKALWMMARLRESRGEISEWLDTLAKLKEVLPDELGVIDELARAYAKAKRPPESASLYRDFLQRKPESTNARFNYAYYLSRSGEYEESIIQYKLLLEKQIDKPEEIHLNLARLYSEKFYQYQASHEHLKTALVLNPDYAPAWFNLGNLNEQLGDLG